MLRSSLLGIFITCVFFCGSSEKKERQRDPDLIPQYSFKVSSFHQKYFTVLTKANYNENETKAIFKKMDALGNQYCKMLWRQRKFRKKKALLFISKQVLEEQRKRKTSNPLHNLITGCWNFYRMNDVRPNEDFELASLVIPEKKKECYSVGFMQPYIMHSVLNCTRLTMLDIDWRIHYGHSQLLDLFQSQKLDSAKNLTKMIRTLRLGWQARYDDKPMEQRMRARITKVCFPKYKALCTESLISFQKNFSRLDSVELQLSYLHEGRYRPVNQGTAMVAFFSNAIDDIYTTKADFKKLLKNVHSSLKENQNMYFIHHAAGRRQFGIYRYHRTGDKSTLTTICRDNYLTAPVAAEIKHYRTHFDRFSSTRKKKITECHALLRKKRKQSKSIKKI